MANDSSISYRSQANWCVFQWQSDTENEKAAERRLFFNRANKDCVASMARRHDHSAGIGHKATIDAAPHRGRAVELHRGAAERRAVSTARALRCHITRDVFRIGDPIAAFRVEIARLARDAESNGVMGRKRKRQE